LVSIINSKLHGWWAKRGSSGSFYLLGVVFDHSFQAVGNRVIPVSALHEYCEIPISPDEIGIPF
jgi:hypothetical protein